MSLKIDGEVGEEMDGVSHVDNFPNPLVGGYPLSGAVEPSESVPKGMGGAYQHGMAARIVFYGYLNQPAKIVSSK